MRPILAIAILLVAWSGASPEPGYSSFLADDLHAAGGAAARSWMEIESSIGRSDRLSVASLQPHSLSVETLKRETAEPALKVASAAADITPDEAMSAAFDTGTDSESTQPAEISLDDLCNAVLTSAQDNDLPAPFFANLLWQESGLRNDIVSSKGALGIAQFMPETAAENGLADPFDPMQAIPASARFLRELRMEFGNLGFVAAAYNAGPHRVIDWLERRANLPQETRDYVLHITGLSIDAWRRMAVNDDALTFVRPLSCRSLPAFASMEQAQSPQALLDQAKLQQAARDEATAETAPKTRGGPHKAAERAPPHARRDAAHHPRITREKRQSA
jgi:soluble lytic murein transglycosylase-like protein